jgi:hypothetical protein
LACAGHYIADLVVEVVLVDFDCMPGAALVLVVVDDLVMPEGVVMVLDLLALAADLVVVADLLMPAGLVMVVDLVVVVAAAGFCTVLVVVIFDELLLVVATGVVWAWADRPPATTNKARIWEMRFMVRKKKSE